MSTRAIKEKWTPRQRKACVDAMLEREPPLSAKETWRRAQAGTLEEGLDPFPIAYATVHSYRQREEEKRRKEWAMDEDTPLSEYAATARAIFAQQFEEESRRGKAADPKRITVLLSGLKQATVMQGRAQIDKGNEERPSRVTSRLSEAKPVRGEALRGSEAMGADQSSAGVRKRGAPAHARGQLEPAA